MVLPVRALARLSAFSVGQDGGVLEARVHAVVQEGYSITAVVHVLAMAARRFAELLHVRPVPQHRPSCVLNNEMSLFPNHLATSRILNPSQQTHIQSHIQSILIPAASRDKFLSFALGQAATTFATNSSRLPLK